MEVYTVFNVFFTVITNIIVVVIMVIIIENAFLFWLITRMIKPSQIITIILK